ncbi:hypothetical protein R3P38DRAFT_2809359 [Favolaschia claudopus]|uniref:Uncharacterized protein n=1 Tax=Favolaschia claudopus TaxID=2862362 RepID=A0AAV9ZDX3_9AGAR
MFQRILARTRRLTDHNSLEQSLSPVPHTMSQTEEFSSDLLSRKGYSVNGSVKGMMLATDIHLPVVVPVMYNIGVDIETATIYDLFIHAWVAYSGLAHVVDMAQGARTVIAHHGVVLETPYTIFYTPQKVAEPKNNSVATNKGKTFFRGNILVIKHTAENTPLDISAAEGPRITMLVRKQLEEGLLV